ncbi:hypothetical protein [Nocardia sp. CA-119907]|uniref:hypothetical protein n=1 Tax=Nocardia sp. CA-119907 TaxID=3239973 RepID=UPI003D96C5CB
MPTSRIELFGVESGYFLLPMQMAAERGVGEATLFDMAVCAGYGHAFHRLVDWHVDELAMTSDDALLLAPLAERYEERLARLAGPALRTLNGYRQDYYRRFVAARERERERARSGHVFGSDDILALGDKSGPLMVLFDLADVLSPDGPTFNRQEFYCSLQLLAVGLQLEDDVHDYAEDFASANITYPIAKAAELAGVSPTAPDLTVEDMGGLIRLLEVDAHCHQLAATAFRESAELAVGAGWKPFADIASSCAARAAELSRSD